MKPLFIPLKREFFEAFARGVKTTEYRKAGPRWNSRTCAPGRAVVLSLGYGKHRRLQGVITRFETSQAATACEDWTACYGDGPAMAACIQIRLDPPLASHDQ